MPRRKGLFRTLRDWWRSAPSEEPAAPDAPAAASGAAGAEAAVDTGSAATVQTAARGEQDVELPPSDVVLSIDALGDVFSFEVLPHFRWTSSAMTLDTLRERAAVHQEASLVELTRRAWPLLRGCDPEQPQAAETLVNEQLAGGWWYDDEKGRITCVPTVRVRIDPALRGHLLPYHVGRLRAEQVAELSEKWLQVVRELEKQGELEPVERRLMLPFVAALVDQDFAKVTQALENTRRSGAAMLAEVLDTARKNHEQIGLFEYANAYDKALGAFCRQMGLTPFSWVDQAAPAQPGQGG